jgi:hypothetical protein
MALLYVRSNLSSGLSHSQLVSRIYTESQFAKVMICSTDTKDLRSAVVKMKEPEFVIRDFGEINARFSGQNANLTGRKRVT